MHIPGRLGQVAQQRALSNGHSLTILLQPQVNSTVPPIHQSPHPHVGAAAARRLSLPSLQLRCIHSLLAAPTSAEQALPLWGAPPSLPCLSTNHRRLLTCPCRPPS